MITFITVWKLKFIDECFGSRMTITGVFVAKFRILTQSSDLIILERNGSRRDSSLLRTVIFPRASEVELLELNIDQFRTILNTFLYLAWQTLCVPLWHVTFGADRKLSRSPFHWSEIQ